MKIRERPLPEAPLAFGDDISPVLAKVYGARGITSDEGLGRSLAQLPPPSRLKGIAEAVSLLEEALRNQHRVLIVGDFDADGATSSALMVLALRALGLERVDFLVPNRFEYGYGLTPEIVDLASKNNPPDLLVTVDNGISSVEGVAAAKAKGWKVLITDHHLPGAELPAADGIVNPNQGGCEFPSKNLAGVGVAFYLLTALRSRLRQSGWFEACGIVEPNMATWLDLVALGTVADVVPLDKINRILVHQGLLRVRSGLCRPGILALLEQAGRDNSRCVAADFGFAVGPRLNAAGRLDDMSLGIQCLLAGDPLFARETAGQLEQLNADRKLIESGMQAEALKVVKALHLDRDQLPWGICLYDEGWHQGVVGLLASRIKERYHRPVIAFAPGDNGQLKGSARSIPGLHIRDALDAVAAANPGLVAKFGGHAMAAGLSLDESAFDEFCIKFDQQVRRQLSTEDLIEELAIDGLLQPSQLNLDLARTLREAGPWGQHFPEPLFRGEFTVVQRRVLGNKHLKLVLAGTEDPDNLIDAIAFNLTEASLNAAMGAVDILYRVDVNAWRGRESLQLLIERILSYS